VPRSVASSQTLANNELLIASAREFPYMPARAGNITPDRIANTAMTSIVLKKSVESAVRDAVVSAWRKSGMVVTTHDRLVLSARIEALLVDDERSPATWTLTLNYFVTNTFTKQNVFVKSVTVHMFRQKFTNPAYALDDVVKLSVDTVLRDPWFRQVVGSAD
jgi:hypothetical protein